MKNRLMRYYIQTLSPVHVGSGGRLQKGLDYFPANGRTWLINRPALETALANHPQALEDFASGKELNIHALTARHHLDLVQIVGGSYYGEASVQEMFEFMRNGMATPYLPGSSIKGSLRTAVLWQLSQTISWQQNYPELLESVLQARDERWAAAPIVEHAFNVAIRRKRPNDANRDLMRVLHVSDAHFDAADLELADTRVFNLTSETTAGWKEMNSPRQHEDYRKATQLAVEALRLGAVAEVILTIDDFLLQHDKAQHEARFRDYAALFEGTALPVLCNEYAARQIARQLKFFEKYKLSGLVKFYEELETLRLSLPPSDFLIRLSWGSGWQGMTGELVEDPDDLQRLRKRFGMGKMTMVGEMPEQCPLCGSKKIHPDNRKEDTGFCFESRHSFPAPGVKKAFFPIFPKTRKIVLEAAQPRYPFGWVRFCSIQPEIPPAEDRSHFAPPAYKAIMQDFVPRAYEAFSPRAAEYASRQAQLSQREPEVVKPQPVIRVNEKLRAEVLKVEGNTYLVRLLQKDEGRELSFTRPFIPVNVGNIIEVLVKATDRAGNQVTKIDFSKKIKG